MAELKKVEEMKWGELKKEGLKKKVYKVGMTKEDLKEVLKEAREEEPESVEMEAGTVTVDSTNPMKAEEVETPDVEVPDKYEEETEKEDKEKEKNSWVGGHVLEKGE